MRAPSRMTAAVVGGLVLLCLAARARARRAPDSSARSRTSRRSRPARFKAACRTRRARRSPARWSRRSARRRRLRSPIERPVRDPDAVARPVSGPRASHRLRRLARPGRSTSAPSARASSRRSRCVTPARSPTRCRRIRCSRRASARRPTPPAEADGTTGAERRRTRRRRAKTPTTITARSRGGCATRAAAILKDVDDSRRSVRRGSGGRYAFVRPAEPVRRSTAVAARDQLLRRHAVLRPGQPADDRLVRHAAAAVLRRQLRAQHRVPRARRAGRRARRLDGARAR